MSRIATASRTAWVSGSGHSCGSLKKTISPSPAKCSTVPPKSAISPPIASWYSWRIVITSSGSAVSESGVKPRRSQNTTAM